MASVLPDNGTLQEVLVPLIDYITCDELYHVWSSRNASTVLIPDYEICAGYIDGKKDSCQASSRLWEGYRTWLLMGITGMFWALWSTPLTI
ncbi:serine protease 30-like [Phyllobates terribilis]|uniref:serine protease 30-like n=1 Tax=Phyllobates terribilis TaxID=111132 RepID=UPI003CCB1B19